MINHNNQMTPKQHILQVSELTKKVRFLLESELYTLWLCGEISNFISASSGHWYLSLKDSKSQVRCAMFKGNNSKVRIKPANGQQVLVKARVSLYEPRGEFQLVLEQMEDAGEGLLRQQYEALKNSLNAEGLFAQSIKKSLPKDITTVGVVTSPTGAAIKDILSVLKRRNPNINVIIYPALVQGDIAKHDICLAIEKANSRKESDVLIVGRGGGSLEDLWSFNEEMVVRAISQCEIPVISAVGHEIDTTLADYVADLRAPTPSAAAEIVSNDIGEVAQKIALTKQRLHTAITRKLSLSKQEVEQYQRHLYRSHPEQQLLVQAQKADELKSRLLQACQRTLSDKKLQPQRLQTALQHLSPETKVKYQQEKVSQLVSRLTTAQDKQLNHRSQQFVSLIEQLQLVSPLATIVRGYSVARDEKGQILRSVKEVKTGDTVNIEVSDGQIKAKVV